MTRFILEKPHVKAVFMGSRMDDPGCENIGFTAQTDAGWPDFMRLNPIFDWTYHEVWEYILLRKIQYPKLYDEGFTSIGEKQMTVRNPHLQSPNAFTLPDGRLERAGRNQNIVSNAKHE